MLKIKKLIIKKSHYMFNYQDLQITNEMIILTPVQNL